MRQPLRTKKKEKENAHKDFEEIWKGTSRDWQSGLGGGSPLYDITQSGVVQFSVLMRNGHVGIVKELERNMLIKIEN